MSVRNNPLAQNATTSPSPSSGPTGMRRPRSAIFSPPTSPLSGSPLSGSPLPGSPLSGLSQDTTRVTTVSNRLPTATSVRHGRDGSKSGTSTWTTFAPSFIKSAEVRKSIDAVGGIEGENDFSGKRYVWLKDTQTAFVKGWVVEEVAADRLLVQCEDGTQREVDGDSVDKVNPAKFDKADDMAELTHLNEASVVHNLQMRYQSDLIYTYSGLFLVTVNPYRPLPIYSNEYVSMYRGRNRDETKPHIFAVADEAFRNLVEEGENQSILVTGESGAGKTENTKKVIQYLAAVAHESAVKSRNSQQSSLSAQILRANPILEAFGNAQTVRNHNSSRFGKFIRIEFNKTGAIAGASVDWYLLEKSRVVRIHSDERNYHIFYQLLRGADGQMKQEFLLDGLDVQDFAYTREGNDSIAGVSDRDEWRRLLEAFGVMAFSAAEQASILRTVAAVLHLGNITVTKESRSADQARLDSDGKKMAARVCELVGVPLEPFLQGLLHPKVKAGREWVEKVQTPEQVRLAIDALAKGMYERAFGDLVSRINRQLDRTGIGLEDSFFIGVLDIAGFEIFVQNSFEQLCINYTNEKLQQFFNHHMFVLEQEEYAREQIEWKFIDFGKDLQPTIDLIELPNPIGIFSCLDEDCVMPKATDKTFTEKLNSLWDKKSEKYRPSRLGQGFILTHYAAEVEYSTAGWLEKNKDPLNDNLTRLLAASTDRHMAVLFADCAEPDEDAGVRTRVKKGLFRTVAQRHKEQLSSLMGQLHSTHPHFVRCILPNDKKRAKQFEKVLVLDQLRCNGVLEGIRIARTGFPNRLPFAEFRQRYEVLCRNLPKGYLEGQAAARLMLDRIGLDKALYRLGLGKVFFRAGVLAELEEQRDGLISDIMARFQSTARGFLQRRIAFRTLYRAEATRLIQRNFQVYLDLCQNPWWQLMVKMKPLLGPTRTATEVKKRDDMIRQLGERIQVEASERQKLEEERRNCQAEMMRIQQTLESERGLALDKEEIFKRLQIREVELEDKLAGALDDQERLEDQLDSLLQAKKRAEEDLDRFRTQLDQAAVLVARLEADKSELSRRATELETAMEDACQEQSERSEKETFLQGEVKMLQSQLSLKDRKTRELENKLLKVDHEVELKLVATEKELETARRKNGELGAETGEVREQLKQLSQTCTDYEDLVRKKESELVLLRGDSKKHETERRHLEEQQKMLGSEREKASARLQDVQAELVAMKSRHAQLGREAEDAKRLLQARLSEDEQAEEKGRVLESQIGDLKEQLYQTQMDLSRERQSRDDVVLLGEHRYQSLQDEYGRLNEAKITIEKELYAQQDKLRRTMELRTSAEKERDEARQEMRSLRTAKTQAEEALGEAQEAGERAALRIAREREDSVRRDIEAADERARWFEEKSAKLNGQVEELNKLILESGDFGLKEDQAKERLERELHTVKSRLAASENDNRALLNKIQQKGLEIARWSSRAAEASRGQVTVLQRDKARVEEQKAKVDRQLAESQIEVASLEKKMEKLRLNVEDLQHEVAREAKKSRNADKSVTHASTQLAEANSTLESERQLHTQAQGMVRTLQSTLDSRDQEVAELREQDSVRKADMEELQDRLQLAEMQKRQLESQLEREAPWTDRYDDESPSVCRVRKLEKANSRLHDQLDDSCKKVSVLEKAVRTGELSLSDIQTRSHQEILDLVHGQEESRRSLLHSHTDAIAELTEIKEDFERLKHERARLELEVRDSRSELQDMALARDQEAASRTRLVQETSDLHMRLDVETSKLMDVTASLALYKGRADEYSGKLEQADMVVLKARRAEQFAKQQAKEAEDTCAEIMSERKRLDTNMDDLQAEKQRLEEKMEDISTDLETALQAKKRLQHELEDYRHQRANDIEDTESSMEQTRRKYQAEFASLTKELDLVREQKLSQQGDMTRLREELDELRGKWDDEVLNSSTWCKEKSRLEATLSDVVASRDEAVQAHKEAQGKIVNLLSQVRTLRSSVDTVTSERDSLEREKGRIESRLEEAKSGLEELAKGESPSLREAAGLDREMLSLREGLAQQEDMAAAAVEKMRRAEALVSEMQKDMLAERERSVELHKQKAALEKSLNEVQVRLVDLETKGFSSASHDIKFLNKRIQELETQLEKQENKRSKEQRSMRNVDRTVRDLQTQMERKEKQNGQLAEDVRRMRDKVDKLLKTIDELQAAESGVQLTARRAERELREERDKSTRLERELQGWKTIRSGAGPAIPGRKSSIGRAPSMSKGFL